MPEEEFWQRAEAGIKSANPGSFSVREQLHKEAADARASSLYEQIGKLQIEIAELHRRAIDGTGAANHNAIARGQVMRELALMANHYGPPPEDREGALKWIEKTLDRDPKLAAEIDAAMIAAGRARRTKGRARGSKIGRQSPEAAPEIIAAVVCDSNIRSHQAHLRVPQGPLPRFGKEPEPPRSDGGTDQSVLGPTTIARIAGYVSVEIGKAASTEQNPAIRSDR